MNSYGRKVTGHQPLTFGLEKLDIRQVDHKDIKNRNDQEKSEFGKLTAYKQGKLIKEANVVQKYMNQAFKEMKAVRAVNRRELYLEQEKMIEEAI